VYRHFPGRGQFAEGECQSEHERVIDRERERDSKQLVLELMGGWRRCCIVMPRAMRSRLSRECL